MRPTGGFCKCELRLTERTSTSCADSRSLPIVRVFANVSSLQEKGSKNQRLTMEHTGSKTSHLSTVVDVRSEFKTCFASGIEGVTVGIVAIFWVDSKRG